MRFGTTLVALTSILATNCVRAEDFDIVTYSVVPQVTLMSNVLNRGVSDSLNRPGAQVGVEVAHESGLIGLVQVNNVSRKEFNSGAGIDITAAAGWRFGNPDKWHFGIGLATEIFPGARFDAPQGFDFVNMTPTDVTSTRFNTAYAVIEAGYGHLQGRVMNVISRTYRGANTGGVCGTMLQFSSDPTKALECYARGDHGSRGTWLFDLDYKYPIRTDTTIDLHAGYQRVANFPEADTFDYRIGVTHVRWGIEWNLSWAGVRVRTHEHYLVQDGDSTKATDKSMLFPSATHRF
jgi:hypothetical protein